MPTNEIKKDAREGKGTVPSLEHKWDKAKGASKKSTGKSDDWALTNYIYQKERDASVTASSRLLASAESEIREAIYKQDSVPMGRPFPLVVHFNGSTVPFMAVIAKVPSASEQQRGILSKVALTTVKWGLLLKGSPKCWIAISYELNGRNQLVNGKALPRAIEAHEAKEFFHKCGVPVPAHHE